MGGISPIDRLIDRTDKFMKKDAQSLKSRRRSSAPTQLLFLRKRDGMNLENVCELFQERIGYRFEKPSLLRQALTHSSFANEQKETDYERLEFLGDAVLELLVSDHLFSEKTKMREGELTKLRASLVCEPTLSFCSREIELSKYILLGKGEEQTGGRNRDSIISDVFEAVIGALYLDGGLKAAKGFVEQYVLKDMYNKIEFVDSKSNLQEYAQEKGIGLRYELVEESGPAHDREYLSAVYLDEKEIARGLGRSKKHAEQEAAYQALKKLR